jgi:hypothetical protein
MRTDNTARLAKMMKTPEDALRVARLSHDQIDDFVRRARAATWRVLAVGISSLALYVGSVLLFGYEGGRFRSLAIVMFAGCLSAFVALFYTKGPAQISSEAAAAMQRRLVDLDRHCQN